MPSDETLKFELDRLTSYDDADLIAELQRVASLVPGGGLTQAEFDKHSRANHSTIAKRFGGWRTALERAGLGDRYGGPQIDDDLRARLANRWTDQEIVDEIIRVAESTARDGLTRALFDQWSDIPSATIATRFGGWKAALDQCGLGGRYVGPMVTDDTRQKSARRLTEEQVVTELRRVAALMGTNTVTVEDFRERSGLFSDAVVRRRFGSWGAGLTAAGLEVSPHGRRWSDDDYFENMLEVWTFHRRAPKHREMNEQPSRIGSGAYEHKWGTWNKARLAFLYRVNHSTSLDSLDPVIENGETDEDEDVLAGEALTREERAPRSAMRPKKRKSGNLRSIPIGLRYKILRRDNFRCVICGASPATTVGCTLHVDHVVPVTRGGLTTEENLRSLCQDCNLGKGAKSEDRETRVMD